MSMNPKKFSATGRWELLIPEEHRANIRTPDFRAYASRSFGERGYFSRRINGKVVRMWDFTEEQYQAVIRLCIGLNRLIPKIKLRVPYDKKSKRTLPGKIRNYSRFAGVLGHAHVQNGTGDGIEQKYDPGSAFDWPRLRRAFKEEEKRRTSAGKISERGTPV